jgi:hypothetical protein
MAYKFIYNPLFLSAWVLVLSQNAFGQSMNPSDTSVKIQDTAKSIHPLSDSSENNPINENPGKWLKTAKGRKELMGYLKTLNTSGGMDYTPSRARFYYRLATIFARHRLYPLAMKCFLKTIKVSRNKMDRSDSSEQAVPDSIPLNAYFMTINAKDDSVVNSRNRVFENGPGDSVSKPIAIHRIAEKFKDGKTAASYAILFHVKQPVPGKRNIISGTNVGHTFITLIKYNTDSSYVSFSFGFYPYKKTLFSGSPLDPSAESIFKNDSEHPWDEVLGKFISRRRFEKILALTTKYSAMQYHLAKNNCTDFGIQAAKIAGIQIFETSGSWVLGRGNNPAITGQSILLGKFRDEDKKTSDSIFKESPLPLK